MTDTLTQLFNRKDQLMAHIRSLDELIKLELQEAGPDQPADDASSGAANAPIQPAARQPEPAQAAPAGNPAYDKLTWGKKLLHHIGKAGEQGITTPELTQALKAAHHGQWSSPAIGNTLYNLEKENKIRVERVAGRNRHFLADQPATQPTGEGDSLS